MRRVLKAVLAGCAGFLYGCLVSLIGVAFAVEGAAFNYLIPASPFSAILLFYARVEPNAKIDNLLSATIGLAAAFWTAVFAAAHVMRSRRMRLAVFALLAVHYIGIIVFYADYRLRGLTLHDGAPHIFVLCMYLAGQAHVWWELLRDHTRWEDVLTELRQAQQR